MGYYTYFVLEANGVARDQNSKMVLGEIPSIIRNDLEEEIEKLGVFDNGDCDFGWQSSEQKWYDHEEDMLTLSHRFPDILFTLYGDGEGSEDMWYAYYYNGAVQNAPATITFDNFDESKLVKSNNSELFSANRKYSYEW